MGKPRLIIIIRHAQSEGNRDKAIHQNTPDHRVGLTDEGHEQARAAGSKLRALLREDDTLHFFISPYKRTRQTTEGILETLCSNKSSPSPFQRQNIQIYEEPRLREQDFGNFQPGSEEVERLWKERAKYGHFFYRIPNGESGADVYDRVSAFNGSLWRRFNENQMASVAVLVTHGLCSRVFLMAWYHYSVEFFEDLRNINHCEFLVMKLDSDGRYILQNELRTWSALRRERLARRSVSLTASSPPPHIPAYRWGRANVANEEKNREQQLSKPLQRQNTADLFRDDEQTRPRPVQREHSRPNDKSRLQQHEDSQELIRFKDALTQPENSGEVPSHVGGKHDTTSAQDHGDLSQSLQNLAIENQSGAAGHLEPQFNDVAYFGRDGGGSKSGAASPFEMSDDDDDKNKNSGSSHTPKAQSSTKTASIAIPTGEGSLAKALRGELNAMGKGPTFAMADALGDRSDAEVEEDDKLMGTKAKEKKETQRILEDELAERRARAQKGDIY